MDLVYGAGRIDRLVPGIDALLSSWRRRERDLGELYLQHKPGTPPDRLVVEDLAVTMLVNSRVAARAAASAFRLGATVDLGSLPGKALEATTDQERQVVAHVIGNVASWPGFGASLATKALHKKRPALIPVLDNQAIFGAYMNPRWPGKPSSTDTVKGAPRIKEALDWIALDLVRPENEAAWSHVHAIEAGHPRTELFDMIWWTYFRQVEPYVQPDSSLRLRKVSRLRSRPSNRSPNTSARRPSTRSLQTRTDHPVRHAMKGALWTAQNVWTAWRFSPAGAYKERAARP